MSEKRRKIGLVIEVVAGVATIASVGLVLPEWIMVSSLAVWTAGGLLAVW